LVSGLRRIAYQPSRREADLIGLALVVVGCGVDALTGPDYSPLLFYVPSVMYVAWFCGRGVGWTSCALISAGIFFLHYGDHGAAGGLRSVDYNAITRILTIAFVYWIMCRLRRNTLDLRNTKLRLEDLNRQKDTLFGIVSHDLRNPLSAMISFAEVMRRSADRLPPEQLKEYAQQCYDAASRACALLRDLLDWAQLQMNSPTPERTSFDVGQLLEDCVADARTTAQAKAIDLSVEVDAAPLHVYADRAAVKSVLGNLLNNALKFTMPGGRVTLTARPQEQAAEIAVQDTGVGIPENRLSDLFAIDRVRSTTGTQGEVGTGFGLLLCRELVERNGGRIAVTSKVDEGSRFAFTLPIHPRALREAA
jgi:signal transduction histidine kinase